MADRTPSAGTRRRVPFVMLLAAGLGFGLAPIVAAGASVDAERLAQRRTPVVDVFESCRDAVVSISSTEIVNVRSRAPVDSFFDDFFDMPTRSRQQRRVGMGSGFVIHPDGYIVTNAHVVARTQKQKVIFGDDRAYDATIIASDPDRDLAILKIEADSPLATLPLGRSHDLLIGETVVAIGNPLGYAQTVTAGVVSAVNREIAVTPELAFTGLIQTDASINPGNSGGPLLNVLGELIGVNTAIRGDAENIGFAIPVDQLRELLPELLDVERRYGIEVGLRVDNLTEPRIREVRRGSPADDAGVRTGDLLLAVDGRRVKKGIDFDLALIRRRPNDRVRLELDRAGQFVETEMQLRPRPVPDGAMLAIEKLGIHVTPLAPDVARDLGLRKTDGLLVSEVNDDGPAYMTGLRRYDVLLSVGRHYVATVDDLGQLLEQADPGDEVSVRVLRIERRRKVILRGTVEIG